MRTITIKGKGKSVKNPDLVIFKISISIYKEEFDDALETMNEIVNTLKLSLINIGFDNEDLKTTKFDIQPQYKHIEKGIINKEYQSKFIGFKINHNLKLEFDLDNNKISEVLNCLKDFNERLEFRLIFSVKDQELMKKEVLINAAENARFNAEILAEASLAKLGKLIKIDYNWIDVTFESDTYFDYDYDTAPMLSQSFRSMPITPEEIEISDTITFVWEII